MLVLGLHANAARHPEEVATAEELLKTHGEHLQLIFGDFPFLQVAHIRDESLEWVLRNVGCDTASFLSGPWGSRLGWEIRLKHENLLKGEFVFKARLEAPLPGLCESMEAPSASSRDARASPPKAHSVHSSLFPWPSHL